MSTRRHTIRSLNPGSGEGDVLVLAQPLSFWGGFDPATGVIIDQHHPQAGQTVAGKILALPASRGSAGTPGGLAEALRLGCGPAGIILKAADINIAIGAMIAARLYDLGCPVVVLDDDGYSDLVTGMRATIAGDEVVIAGPGCVP